MILILANKWDLTVDLVVLELQRRNASFVRLNTEELPYWSVAARFPAESIWLRSSKGVSVVASEVSAIWNRRPGHVYDDIVPGERPSLATQKFVTDQWFSWLESLQLTSSVLWVNHPNSNGLMENKLRQLKLAIEIGFSVPETLVTNDVHEARSWATGLGERVICKALYSPLIEEPEGDQFIFTNLVEDMSVDLEKSLSLAPVIFQRAILSKQDYRVTIVGNNVFAVKVGIPDSILDWRTASSNIEFALCDLPAEIEGKCRKYVESSGLSFGAIDLIESEGVFYFLEINPNGEWGWLERPNGIPISVALCDLLEKKANE